MADRHEVPKANGLRGPEQRLGHFAIVGEDDFGDRPVIVQENIDKLRRAGEVGQYLVPTYLAGLAADPRLVGTVVVPYTASDIPELALTVGQARTPLHANSERPEVLINTGGWKAYDKLLKERESTIQQIAHKLGIAPAEIDGPLFASFGLLHELGHIRDFISKDFDQAAIDAAINRDMDSLPIKGVNPSLLMQWTRKHPIRAYKYFKAHEAELNEQGIYSMKQAIFVQDAAYRLIPTEAVADQFAVDVLRDRSASPS